MAMRKGLGQGRGSGWKNLAQDDPRRHGLSAKGIKSAMLSPRLRKRIAANPQLKGMSFQQLQKKGVFLKYQGDADKDKVVNVRDCQPLNKDMQDKRFNVKKGMEIVARSENTQSGFRHIVILVKDGWQEVDRAKATYQNRKWESYEFETAIRNLLNKTDELTEAEKKSFLDKQSGKEKAEVEQQFKTIAAVAKMGEFFADTKEEKNDWKKRMLKAGLPELDIPDDWDTLSEDEKEKRLNKVIEFAGKKDVKKKDFKDSDGDYVPDKIDCQPKNPKKQDDDDYTAEYGEPEAEVLTAQTSTDKSPITLTQRVKGLGKKGWNYVSELAKTHKENREKFEQEIQNLSDSQLKEVAIRFRDTSTFGSGNPYERELVRREQERQRIAKKLAEAKSGKKTGGLSDLF